MNCTFGPFANFAFRHRHATITATVNIATRAVVAPMMMAYVADPVSSVGGEDGGADDSPFFELAEGSVPSELAGGSVPFVIDMTCSMLIPKALDAVFAVASLLLSALLTVEVSLPAGMVISAVTSAAV